jgi:Transposase DDE domain.
LCYIADATGFGFGDKYKLNWERGTQIRTVQSHVRLEVIMVVDENKRKIITTVEAGGPYESEIEMLRKALKRLEPQKGLPFIADKGYDAVDIIESLLGRGFEPAIRIKETMRMSIRHPLRKLSNENWKRYGRMRYRVEQLFGSIEQKIGSSFKLLREDLARKASIACAILWNFWVLAVSLFLLFLSGMLQYSYAKGCGRFLEQPLKFHHI